MGSPSKSQYGAAEDRRHRSWSNDSGNDDRRRHRRDHEADGGRSEGARDAKGRRFEDARGERERKRRRSRSPERDSTRRQRDDRDSTHRSRRDRTSDRKDADSKHNARSDRSLARKHEDEDDVHSRRNKGPLPSQAAAFQGNADPGALIVAGDKGEVEKQKPNFAATGLLAAASNSITQADGTSIVLKYHEPAEARKPPAKDVWKLFVFKGAEVVDTIELSLRSCWLVGRELSVVDLAAEHPSISKQHAVIQFRYIEKRNEFGDKSGKVRPYLIDLESANGTLLNKDEVPASRYLELQNKDMIQFGHSTREYVLMLSPRD
jgi:smad nuclear-interacting protein 1